MLQWCTAWQAHTVAIATVVSYAMNISGKHCRLRRFCNIAGLPWHKGVCHEHTLQSVQRTGDGIAQASILPLREANPNAAMAKAKWDMCVDGTEAA